MDISFNGTIFASKATCCIFSSLECIWSTVVRVEEFVRQADMNGVRVGIREWGRLGIQDLVQKKHWAWYAVLWFR